jgi:Ca2+-binding RTX toxin-like protein
MSGQTLSRLSIRGKDCLGNDVLWGRLDKDALSGGSSRDIFVFTKPNTKSSLDRITDYNVRDDSIYLENKVMQQGHAEARQGHSRQAQQEVLCFRQGLGQG